MGWGMHLRRILLLSLGSAAALAVAGLLVYVAAVRGKILDLPVSIPQKMNGSELELVEYCAYSGYFDEDGKKREVTGVAALVLRNGGNDTISRGLIRMYQGDTRLEFSFTMIPPGAVVLVPERHATSFENTPLRNLSGWVKTTSVRQKGRVEEVGRSRLRISNTSKVHLKSAKFWFKRYDAEKSMYIGGRSYSFEVEDLPPGRFVVIPVYGYTSQKYAIVG